MGLQAAAGLASCSPSAYAAAGLGMQACNCKLSERELFPALCSVRLLEQRRSSSPQGGSRQGLQQRMKRRCVATILLLGHPSLPCSISSFKPDLGAEADFLGKEDPEVSTEAQEGKTPPCRANSALRSTRRTIALREQSAQLCPGKTQSIGFTQDRWDRCGMASQGVPAGQEASGTSQDCGVTHPTHPTLMD